jgi:outer membrane protein assembly factor BamB
MAMHPHTACADDWPWFLGPTHDGVSAEKGLLKNWPDTGPPRLWDMKTGETYAAPVIVDGKLILFHRVGDEERVECFEPATPKNIWTFSYPTAYVDRYGYNGGPRCSPTVHQGKIYTFGAEGMLHCLEFATGKKVWARQIRKEFKVTVNFFGVGSSPVIDGNRLLIAAGGAKDAGVLALDPDTGKLIWQASDEPASYATPRAATINGRRCVIHFGRMGLVSIDAGSGKVNWSYPFRSRTYESVNAACPLIADDLIFATASYRTGAVLLKDKGDHVEEIWKSPVMGCHWATPFLDDGHIYGFDGRHEGETTLKCVEWKTGRERWRVNEYGRGSMIKADGKYIILTERGDLVLADLSPAGHKALQRVSYLRYPCWIAPVLADGLLYIQNETRLICLDLRTK